MTAPRYAIYHAPPIGSPWWRFGAGWLGRDEARDVPLTHPALAGVPPERLAALTAQPRRYGFHATLKAPFRLRKGISESMLLQRVAGLAGLLRAAPLGPLLPVWMEGFIALTPVPRQDAVDALAERCVRDLDDLRAPMTDAELARRHPHRLDPRGRELLAQYGYPHVLERFRFHMTLSDVVDAPTAGVLLLRAREAVDALQASTSGLPRLDRLCVFCQHHAEAPFVRIHDEELAP
ncbi:MAG TPA: DUF1045 domain-containing protein [Ramlibacter sp.]|jgi:putative phosphonate metabolism protein